MEADDAILFPKACDRYMNKCRRKNKTLGTKQPKGLNHVKYTATTNDGEEIAKHKIQAALTASHASRVLFISDGEFAYLIFNN